MKKVLIPTGVLIFLVWLFYPLWILSISNWITHGDFINFKENLGPYGDSFGSLNTLFSGLAFFGVMISILLQSKELSLQRMELAQTRDELRGQKEQLEKQGQTLTKQNFENTFFQLLRFYNEITETIYEKNMRAKLVGKEAFQYMEWLLDSQGFRENVPSERTKFFKSRPRNEHYFRHIYEILKFIDLSDIKNKPFYSDLLRAQLSQGELVILFHYCLWKDDSNLKTFVEKYSLLENLQHNVRNEDLMSFTEEAFGNNEQWIKKREEVKKNGQYQFALNV